MPISAQAVAFTFKRNDFDVLQQPVEDGSGGRNVADEFAPVFDRAIAGHYGRTDFVSSHLRIITSKRYAPYYISRED